jgi:hypothetical protein
LQATRDQVHSEFQSKVHGLESELAASREATRQAEAQVGELPGPPAEQGVQAQLSCSELYSEGCLLGAASLECKPVIALQAAEHKATADRNAREVASLSAELAALKVGTGQDA